VKQLHIGPGKDKLPGFDTLDIRPGYDIQADAAGPLPISDSTYDLIYASHVIEHIPWWKTIDTLKEWARILKPGGQLEIWTVNALKVANILVAAEEGMGFSQTPDRWTRYNPEKDIYKWCAGRLFAYGPVPGDPNWHKALFTPKHLRACFVNSGFTNVRVLERPRGKDHGWINLGMCGTKTSDSGPCTEPAASTVPPTT